MKLWPFARKEKALSPVTENRGWFRLIGESFAGAWQRNVVVDFNTQLSFYAVFACITLIATDIAKLGVRLVALDGDGIWSEVTNSAYSPVLRRPNNYQNRIQFWESWIISKLTRGNTVVLKGRDARKVVTSLHILDWDRVTPLVTDDGDVYYELQPDNLAGLTRTVVVPASEIIHDRMNCLFHPLIGVTPLYSAGLAASQGLAIQTDSTKFFSNSSRPGGMLTAPTKIDEATAKRLKDYWEQNFSGDNVGKIAVLGEGLKFEAMSVDPTDAQIVDQLKMTGEVVCSVLHVPPYKVGIGAMPAYNNVQALNVEYYSQALQHLIEAAELCMDEGLNTGPGLGTEFDVDNLLRMDSVSQATVSKELVSGGIMKPNEARKRFSLKPVVGGDTPYLQQQNFGLAALAERDAAGPPSTPGAPAPAPEPAPANDDDAKLEVEAGKAMVAILKGFAHV